MRLLLVWAALAAPILISTSQYDNARTGANLHESSLTPRNVNVKQFGKLFSLAVDGDVYAQPLYMQGLAMGAKGVHDVLFIATEHDSVYAFDAADKPATYLWVRRFIDSLKGITTVPAGVASCPFISPEIGITSTPVIDRETKTLYVLVRTSESNGSGESRYWQRLHALDLGTGAEKFGGPVTIRGSAPTKKGGLFGLISGSVEFLSLHENPRAALLLSRGKVYLSWGSSCDVPPYHGWVIAYDSRTLKQAGAFVTSPETMESGIWQSDTGPAADEAGNVYVSTGNGVFNASSGGRDYGDTLLKLRLGSGFQVIDYFTPFDQERLAREDADLGSGGPVLVPPQPGGAPLVIAGGKGGVIYAIPRDRMGKFRAGGNASSVQSIPLGKSIKSAPAYWNGHVYYAAGDDTVRDFAVRGNRLGQVAAAKADLREPGATPAISANGTEDGVVWCIETRVWNGNDRTGTLHAYDALNVAREIYSSDWNSERDRAGLARRFTIPTVANGRVYVGGSGTVDVYGLLNKP